MLKDEKIYVAGHRGLVGSAIVRSLLKHGYTNLVLPQRAALNLSNQSAVNTFFEQERPSYVFLAAAKVGGIYANDTYKGEFIYQNLTIQNNVIEASRNSKVKRLLFLGSSCIYPRHCPQPMREEHLLQGALESTNEPYAIAKIAGIKLCDAYNFQYGTDFVSIMPTNLYGPGDNFDLQSSHVLPALMHKIHTAKVNKSKSFTIWGTGNVLREFLYVDDMAEACLFVMNQIGHKEMLNVGSGHEVSIRELAEIICEIIDYQGGVEFDSQKPDGTPRKLLDSTKINALGWRAKIDLKQGLARTYEWFVQQQTLRPHQVGEGPGMRALE